MSSDLSVTSRHASPRPAKTKEELLPTIRGITESETLPSAPRPSTRAKTDGSVRSESRASIGKSAEDHWQLPRRLQGSVHLLRKTFSRARASIVATESSTSLGETADAQGNSAIAWEKAGAVVKGSAAVLRQRAELRETFKQVVVDAREQGCEQQRQATLKKELEEQLLASLMAAVANEELSNAGIKSMKLIVEQLSALGAEDLGDKLCVVAAVVLDGEELQKLQDMLLDHLYGLDELQTLNQDHHGKLQSIIASVMKEASFLKSLMGRTAGNSFKGSTGALRSPVVPTASQPSPQPPSELLNIERTSRRARTHNTLSVGAVPKCMLEEPSDDESGSTFGASSSNSHLRMEGRGLKRFQDAANRVAPVPVPHLWHVVREAMKQSQNDWLPIAKTQNHPPSMDEEDEGEEEEEHVHFEQKDEPEHIFPHHLSNWASDWDADAHPSVEPSFHGSSSADCNSFSLVPVESREPAGELSGILQINGWSCPSRSPSATQPAKSQSLPITQRRPSKETVEQPSRLVTLAAIKTFPAIKPVCRQPGDAKSPSHSASLSAREFENNRSPRSSESKSETRSQKLTPRFRHLILHGSMQ